MLAFLCVCEPLPRAPPVCVVRCCVAVKWAENTKRQKGVVGLQSVPQHGSCSHRPRQQQRGRGEGRGSLLTCPQPNMERLCFAAPHREPLAPTVRCRRPRLLMKLSRGLLCPRTDAGPAVHQPSSSGAQPPLSEYCAHPAPPTHHTHTRTHSHTRSCAHSGVGWVEPVAGPSPTHPLFRGYFMCHRPTHTQTHAPALPLSQRPLPRTSFAAHTLSLQHIRPHTHTIKGALR